MPTPPKFRNEREVILHRRLEAMRLLLVADGYDVKLEPMSFVPGTPPKATFTLSVSCIPEAPDPNEASGADGRLVK